MKACINPKRTLNALAGLGAIGLLAFSQVSFAEDKRTNNQGSDGKDGIPIWDMAFVAIDTNDNKTVEWSEIARHYNDKLSEAGWGKEEALNRFDHSNDDVLDENEYDRFVQSLWQNTSNRTNTSTNQQAQTKQENHQSVAQAAKADDKRNQQSRQETSEQNPNQFAVKKGAKSDAASLAADELLGMNVVGKNGKEIGSVENLLLNQQGQIVAVIAEVGGVLDVGDTHVAVPWDQASIKNSKLHLPITKDNASDYSIFKDQYFSKYDVGTKSTVDDTLETGPDIWKATDLIDDYVLLENEVGYGYITDLTFNRKGKLQSVVISAANPDFGYGYYAYPWYGFGRDFGWDPGLNYYILPYTGRDLVGL